MRQHRTRMQTYATEFVVYAERVRTSVVELADKCGELGESLDKDRLRARPVKELLVALDEIGPGALKRYEHRVLICTPDQMTVQRLEKLYKHAPGLLRILASFVLVKWTEFQTQPWGELYSSFLTANGSELALPIANDPVMPPAVLWSRESDVTVELSARLVGGDVQQVYEYLQFHYGLRRNQEFLALVLVEWLRQQLSVNSSMRLLQQPTPLQALLLPPLPGRLTTHTHLKIVGLLIKAGFGGDKRMSSEMRQWLTAHLLRSTFGDPRNVALSQPWLDIRGGYPTEFGGLLSSLAEVDLEFFFRHAMEDEQRARFWRRYLGAMQRTGCVLNTQKYEQLRSSVALEPKYRSALDRTYRFSKKADAAAFFMVFANHVVIEFSVTGNAAYVYRRDVFEDVFESRILRGQIGTAEDLKAKDRASFRQLHTGRWMDDLTVTLAACGIHGNIVRQAW